MIKYQNIDFDKNILNQKFILNIALACNIINIVYFSIFFLINSYLPSPFVWDKSDTFMDFYNPLYWVIKDGFYSVFNSVYPPLSYFFLKIFATAIDPALVISPQQLRNDHLYLSIMLACGSLGILFALLNLGEWRKFHNKLKLFLIFSLSVPFLYSVERGNIIFLAILFLALYFNSNNILIRAFFFSILVNIKPYFLLLLLQYFNVYSFKTKPIILEVIFSLLLFLSLGFFSEINYLRFLSTYLGFTSGNALSWDGFVSLPNNITSIIFIIKNFIFFEGGRTYNFWLSFIKVIALLGPLILLLLVLVRPLTKLENLIAIFILIANFSVGTGGYIYLIYIILIPYLINSDQYKLLAAYIFLIFFLPMDWVQIIRVVYAANKNMYLSNLFMGADFEVWVCLGSFLRPIFNFSLMCIFIFKIIIKYGAFKKRQLIPI